MSAIHGGEAAGLDPARDVVSAVLDAMITDDTNQSERLIALYEQASPEDKAVIDQVLICLCGYSMPSLIETASGGEVLYRYTGGDAC